MEITEILKALSDETRLRILNIIKEGELCVCDIENILKLNQSNASKHLNKLKNSKLILGTKKAQWVYFSLNNETLENYFFIKKIIQNNLLEDIFQKDMENLKNYLKTKKGCDIS